MPPPANGYDRLNQSALRLFTKAIEADPCGDMESTLLRICTLYPKLRERVDERNKRRQEKESGVSILAPPPPPPPPQPRKPPPLPVYTPDLGACSQIIHPLDTCVVSCLSLTENDPSAPHVAESLLRILSTQVPLVVNGKTRIFTLSDNVLVKAGGAAGSEEYELLSFVASHFPSVSAPHPLGYMEIGQLSVLFMIRLPGQCLLDRWSHLDVTQKQTVRTILDDMCQELRRLELPAGCAMGSVQEPRRCKDCRKYIRISSDPIYTESQFNEFLVHSDIPRQRVAKGFHQWVFSMLRTDHRIVFTHGDLHPRNIMFDIDSEGRISLGLVDWEMAGFYPEYWEMVKAFNTRAMSDASDWWDYLPPSILGYDHDILIQHIIERAFLY